MNYKFHGELYEIPYLNKKFSGISRDMESQMNVVEQKLTRMVVITLHCMLKGPPSPQLYMKE
jgi:hypothetical protein